MRYVFFLFTVFFFVTSASAETAPVPAAHPMAENKARLAEEQNEANSLEKEMKTIKGSLEEIRTKAVKVTAQVKKSESVLLSLEKQIVSKENEKNDIEQRLTKDKKSLGRLVLALARLDRLPPEAVMMKPGAPLETAQSTLILESTLPRIYGRADSLRSDLNRVGQILSTLEADKKRARKKNAQLKEQQQELSALLKKRESLYAKTEKNMVKTRAEIAFISKRAENLKDLVSKIDRYEQGKPEQVAATRPAPKNPKNMPKIGNAQMPISGIIKTRYGETDNIGAQSQGIRIAGRSGGIVTAPLSGTVRFAGNFRNYGQIVIIEHRKGYHSLLAGLGKIDTLEGRTVETGEAVGTLPASGDTGGPEMYYELRYKGKPVNPALFLGTS